MSSIPAVTRNLLIINVLFFLAQSLLGNAIPINRYLALHFFESDYFMPHQVITYMFLHGGIFHIFFNMFALFMFGRTLEMVWGGKKFLLYYILTGIGAALAQEIVYTFQFSEIIFNSAITQINTGTDIITRQEFFNLLPATLGASGAIFGILVAFGMLFPNVELFIIPFPFPIKAKWFVIGYGVLELGWGISNDPADNVAHFAHLGGLIMGLIILLYWKKKGKLTTNDGSFRR
ncbi:MAG: rhomboid family intramembrane serine protease [Prevotella sp.]|nr:rhomboid family intramembrane serine protease [Prevotella sp.]